MERRIRHAFVDSSPLDDMAIPLIAMTRGEKVRELLCRPPIAEILAELGSWTREVQLHDEGLFFRLHDAFPGTDDVAALVERGRLVSVALFGRTKTSPYR